ncbi:uncharacterized protein LODBEIA_P25750 [Lodderomyces beijingensis]|uniref:Exosome complex component CSL4 C-terminal domain-containing protein n=1 Tax=Lodderomyces beijingensis TaxID=1775926 RepID=A0ABP0ZJN3_9ASCO
MDSKVVVPGQYLAPTYQLQDGKQVKYIAGRGTVVNSIRSDESQPSIPVICASIVGHKYIKQIANDNDNAQGEDEADEAEDEKQLTYIVCVIPRGQPMPSADDMSSISTTNSINLPRENDVVLVRITRISQKQAQCEIIAMANKAILSDSGIGSNGATAHASLPMGGGSQHNFNPASIASSSTMSSNAQIYDLGENFRGIIRSQDIRSTERDRVVVGECFRPGDVVRCVILSLGDGSNYYLSTARNDLGVVFAKSEGGAGSLMYPVDWLHMIDVDTGLVEKRKNANPFLE